MKRNLLIVLICLSAAWAAAQNMQVQNMINYLRNKDYAKAKAAADAAAVHETTRNSAKMWMNRGNVYSAISDTSARDGIDPEAEEKALDAYINCLKLDKDHIYRDDVDGDLHVKSNLVRAVATTRNKANAYRMKGQYDKALKCYDLLEASIPFDFDGGIKRNNVTKEKLMFDRFEIYKAAGDKAKTKEYADKLIEVKYKDPGVYQDMVRISMVDRDTAAALSYIEKGKVLFEDNMMLIGTEIDIYLARKKTDVLKDRLNSAIEIAPDNEILYAVLGQVYEKTNDMPNAEKNYLKALEIKPDMETLNYKLGALYFNTGVEFNKKLIDLKPGDAKNKEYEQKVKDNFSKAAPYLEKAYESRPEEAYRQRLFQVYTRLGETEKASKFKKTTK